MISLEEAERIARDQLSPERWGGDDIRLIPGATVTRDYGWVFSFELVTSPGSGDAPPIILGGPGPLFVRKVDGRAVFFLPGHTVESWLDQYEQGELVETPILGGTCLGFVRRDSPAARGDVSETP